MSEKELKAILIGTVEAVIGLEESILHKTYVTINLKRQILNMMRELPFEECIKLIPRIIPKECFKMVKTE